MRRVRERLEWPRSAEHGQSAGVGAPQGCNEWMLDSWTCFGTRPCVIAASTAASSLFPGFPTAPWDAGADGIECVWGDQGNAGRDSFKRQGRWQGVGGSSKACLQPNACRNSMWLGIALPSSVRLILASPGRNRIAVVTASKGCCTHSNFVPLSHKLASSNVPSRVVPDLAHRHMQHSRARIRLGHSA